MHHIPSGIRIRSESERTQFRNREIAFEVLRERLIELEKSKIAQDRNNIRKNQVGNGSRSELKARTIQVCNDLVTDHRTGKRITWKDYSRGKLEKLW